MNECQKVQPGWSNMGPTSVQLNIQEARTLPAPLTTKMFNILNTTEPEESSQSDMMLCA